MVDLININDLIPTDDATGDDLVLIVQGGVAKIVPARGLPFIQGIPGETGRGINYKGSLDSEADLPSIGAVGDGWFIDTDLWIWNDDIGAFQKVANIKGLTGNAFDIVGSVDDVSQLPATGLDGQAWVVAEDMYMWNRPTQSWVYVARYKGERGNPLWIAGRVTLPSELPMIGNDEGYAYIVDENIYVWNKQSGAWEDRGRFQGFKGDKGDTGNHFEIIGRSETTTGLPASGIEGQGWIVGKNLYVWDVSVTPNKWTNRGRFQGPDNVLEVGTVTKGVEPEVTLTDTVYGQKINFVLPKGDTGDISAELEALRLEVETNTNTVAADKAIVNTDKGIVAADKATVADDKNIVASDKQTTLEYKDLANKYANAPENEEIVTGSGDYSAYHWSKRAEYVAGGGVYTVNGKGGEDIVLVPADLGAVEQTEFDQKIKELDAAAIAYAIALG